MTGLWPDKKGTVLACVLLRWAVCDGLSQIMGVQPPCNASAPACTDPDTGAKVCCTFVENRRCSARWLFWDVSVRRFVRWVWRCCPVRGAIMGYMSV